MIVGIVVIGTYSSIGVASPLLFGAHGWTVGKAAEKKVTA